MLTPIPFSHGPEFELLLDDDHIELHGAPEEAAGVTLRGSIVLNCHEQTKVKSITLKFIGMTNISWAEGTGAHTKHYKAEEKILEKEWTFLELQKKAHHLSQGQYKWDFSLPLPGNLPESVSHPMGQISYKLKAYCDRPTFSSNHVIRRNIRVTRLMLPSNLELHQSVVISNIWADKVAYNISIPTKVYSADHRIPINFDLAPIASDLTVRSVACSLKEYITCCTDEHQRTEGRVIQHMRDDQFTFEDGHYYKTELIRIPAERHVHYDMVNRNVQVKHKIKFVVSLQNGDGHISELRATIPVIIVPMVPEDDENALPMYEESWRSIPYDSETFAHMVAMGEIQAPPQLLNSSDSHSTLSSSASSSSSSIHEEHDVEWMDGLCRVPSYATALRTQDMSSTCTFPLPSYDSIIIA